MRRCVSGRGTDRTAGRWRTAATALLSALWLAASCAALAADETTLQVYFNHQRLAVDPAGCVSVFPVARSVPTTRAVASAALRELFAGTSAAEREAGYRSPFSAATAGLLKGLHIDQGTAYVNLTDLRDQLGGVTSSCGAAEFQSQVYRTLRQFPTIRRVIYAIEGKPRTFYEWMGESCDLTNDHCDAAPFRR